MRMRAVQRAEKKKWIIKKVFFLVVAMLLFALVPAGASAQKKIGILIFNEEARYLESKNGIMDELKQSGYGEPAAAYTVENAKGSKARVVEIAHKFAAAKMDLIITLGTSATVPTAKIIRDVPLVFSMVYDPVEAGIAKSLKSSGNNTTGAGARVPISTVVSSLMEFAPVKRLAVLYTPGEKNSESQLLEIQKIQPLFQIKVIPVILTKKEEAAQVVSGVGSAADAMYLTGSSVVGAAALEIVSGANRAKVVTVTHLDDLVEKGALLGVCADSYQVGRLSGMKAARILKGAKPSSLPIEFGKKLDVIVNMKTAQAGGFLLPPAFLKKVTRLIE